MMKKLQKYSLLVLFFIGIISANAQSFFPVLPGSTISDSNDESVLRTWLEKGDLSPSGTLLYRRSSNGASVSAYHNAVDGKGLTLTIFKTNNGNVFGFYTTATISSTSSYGSSNDAFVFNLTSDRKASVEYPQYSIYNNVNYGPTFGGGHDFQMNNSMDGGYLNGHSYNSVDGSAVRSSTAIKALTGVNTTSATYHFGAGFITEIEVYGIEFKTSVPIIQGQDITVALDTNGKATIRAQDIDTGTTDPDGPVTLSIDINSFTCDDLGGSSNAITPTYISSVSQNTNSWGGGYNPNTNEFWYPQWANSTVYTYDADHNSTGSFNTGQVQMMQLWMDTDSETDYYTANWGYRTITKRSGSSTVWSYDLGTTASGVATDADYVYAMPFNNNFIKVLDKNTGALVRTINLPGHITSYGGLVVSNSFIYINGRMVWGDNPNSEQYIHQLDLKGNYIGYTETQGKNARITAFDGETIWSSNHDNVIRGFQISDGSGYGGSGGSNSVTLTATDPLGNSSSEKFNVTVEDHINPTIVLNGASSVNVNSDTVFNDPGAKPSDNCSAEIEISGTVDTKTPGVYTLSYIAVDQNGNKSSTITREVTVVDATPPEAKAGRVTIELDEKGIATVNAASLNNGSTDNVDGTLTYTLDRTSFNCDDLNSETSSSQAVNMSFVGNLTQNTHSHAGGYNPNTNEFWYPAWQGPTVHVYDENHQFLRTFNSGQPSIMQLWMDTDSDTDYYVADWYSTFTRVDKNGQKVWSYTSTNGRDASGISTDNNFAYLLSSKGDKIEVVNKNTGEFVKVITLPGTVTIHGGLVIANKRIYIAGMAENWSTNPNNQKYVHQLDMDGTYISSTSTNGVTPYNTVFDGETMWVSQNNNSITGIKISEGNAYGAGAGVPVTLTVTDQLGNSSTAEGIVVVVDKIAPTIVSKPISVVLEAGGTVSITAQDVLESGIDNCASEIVYTISKDTFGATDANNSPVTIQLTGTDASGNVTTVPAQVTVIDIVQGITVQLDTSGNATITGSDLVNGSFDTSSNVTLSLDTTEFDCSDLGTTAITPTLLGTESQNTHSKGGGYNPNTNEFWYPQWSGRTVNVYDANHQFLRTFDSGQSTMMQLWMDTDSETDYYTANYSHRTYTRIDENGQKVWSYKSTNGNNPGGISTDATYAYLLADGGNKIEVVDKNTGVFVKYITLPGSIYHWGGLVIANNRIYIGGNAQSWSTNPSNHQYIHQLDMDGTYISSTSTNGVTPYSMAFDGETMWVSQNTNTITGIQISNGNTYNRLQVTLTATDTNGNTSKAMVNVTVVDKIAPAITLNGAASVTLRRGESFTDLSASFEDNCAVTLVATGTVDNNTIGTYTLTYKAVDSSNNESETLTRTVTVQNTAPTFTSAPITSVNDNQQYSYTITTEDLNEDVLSITAANLPTWLTMTPSSPTVSTFAGSTKGFADGAASAAKFDEPWGVVVDASGNVYVADVYNAKIRKITPAGVVSTFAGSTPGYADGTGTAAKFRNPTSLAIDAFGNIYVTDQGNYKIRKITLSGVVSTLAGSTSGFADGTGAAAKFGYPGGLDVDAAGNVYVADSNNHKIRKITPAGVVTTFAGSSNSGFLDGIGTAAKFRNPYGIAVDPEGNVYVGEAYNHAVRKITPSGVVSTLAGSGDYGFANGTGAAAKFKHAYGIAIDAAGNLYVADIGNNKIRKITQSGVVTTFAGSDFGYADGIGTAAKFKSPEDIAIDAAGNFYVVDRFNYKVRKIASAGFVLTGNPVGHVGTHSVTLDANDGNGGTAQQTFTITVTDVTAPVAKAKNITVELNASGNASIRPEQLNDGSTDTSGGTLTYVLDKKDFDCADVSLGSNNFSANFNNGYANGFKTNSNANIPTGNSARTMTTWMKLDAIPNTWGSVISQGNGDCSGKMFAIGVINGKLGAWGGCRDWVSNFTVSSGQWIHVAMTYDGNGTVSLYYNGQGQSHNIRSYNTTASKLFMGVETTNNGVSFRNSLDGKLDEVKIFNKALTAAEVQAEMAGSNPASTSLVSHYNFEEGTGREVNDLVGNNHGTAFGFTSSDWSSNTPSAGQINNTVTLTVTDPSGNTSKATANVTVVDEIAPTVVSKPISVTLTANGTVSIVANDVLQSGSDNCGTVTYTLSQSTFGATDAINSPVTVQLTGTDASGNKTTVPVKVTVIDPVPVVITQNITVALDENGNATITAAQIDNGSNSVVGLAEETGLLIDISTLDCSNIGSPVTVTLTVTSTLGATATGTAIVTVTDAIVPIVITQNITVELGTNGTARVAPNLVDNGSSDNCAIDRMVLDKTFFDCSNVGQNTVTLTVTDVNGNVSTKKAIITVVDRIKPTVITQDLTVQLDANGVGSITAAQVDNGSSDNCAIATMLLDTSSFNSSNIGQNTVTLTVTDVYGNVFAKTASITVEDNVKPIVVTQNLTVKLDTNGAGSITAEQVDNGSSDNSGLYTMLLDTSSFTCLSVGNNKVTLTVTDPSGNTSKATANVTVVDEIAPTVVSKPISVTLTANGTVSIVANDVLQSGSDNCGTVTYTLSQSTFGATDAINSPVTVQLTGTDASGNKTTVPVKVTVIDPVPVVITQNITVALNENGNVSITAAQIDNGSSSVVGLADESGLSIDISIFDCSNIGSPVTVTLTVTSTLGATATGTAVVTVTDAINPTVITQNLTVELDEKGNATITPKMIDKGSSDNCAIATYSLSKDSFDCTNVGVNIVTLTVVDVSGNSTSKEATVTVVDTISPTAITKDIIVKLDLNGNATITPEDVNNGSFDNCTFTASLDIKNFDCTNIGVQNIVTLTIRDASGNTNSRTAIVTVKENFKETLDLRTLSSFEAYTGTGAITNSGIVTGDAGTNIGAMTGYFNGTKQYNNALTAQARIDLLKVYIHLNNIFVTHPGTHAPAFGSGETITAGVYSIGGAGSVAGTLTLDGEGDSNAVFIMKFKGAFTAGAASNIILKNGARAANVFWVAQGAISVGASSVINGTLLAYPGAITIGVKSTVKGRLLSSVGAITTAVGAVAELPTGPMIIPINPMRSYTPAKAVDVLGSLENFSLFTSNGAVANASTSGFLGDVGANTGAISGFATSAHIGSFYNANAITAQAKRDLDFAYSKLMLIPNTVTSHTPAFGSGETLHAGVYSTIGAGSLAGTITLDGQGDPNAIFIFKFNGAFAAGAQSKVIFTNGTRRSNVFWISEGAASIGAFSHMKGTILAHGGAATMGAGGNLEGRMLSTVGAIGFSTGVVYTVVHDAECVYDAPRQRTSFAAKEIISVVKTLDVLVFPNPSDGMFEIKLNNTNVASQILLFDLSGKLIERREVSAEQGAKNIVVDKRFLPAGVYLLKIITKDETVTKKLVIKKE